MVQIFSNKYVKIKVGYYHPQRSWGKVMFLQACVILFIGGGSASVHAGKHPPGADTRQTRHPPRDQAPSPPGADTPPWEQTPPDQAPTPGQSMLGDTVIARAVRILLECNLVN